MKLVVLLDGSKFSEAILPSAADLGKAGAAEVTLVTVVDPAEARATWREPPAPSLEREAADPLLGHGVSIPAPAKGKLAEDVVQAGQRLRTEAREYLEGVSRKHFNGSAKTVVLEGDDVAEQIATYARTHRPEIIAMATHGRNAVARLVTGSVASKLLGSGIGPLLLVRPDGLAPASER